MEGIGLPGTSANSDEIFESTLALESTLQRSFTADGAAGSACEVRALTVKHRFGSNAIATSHVIPRDTGHEQLAKNASQRPNVYVLRQNCRSNMPALGVGAPRQDGGLLTRKQCV